MADKYYVIQAGEGGVGVEELTKEELLKHLNDEDPYWGSDAEFSDSLPQERYGRESRSWDMRSTRGVVIVKGEIVVPKPKQVVTEFEI